jgi:hypothetical protein
MLLNFVIVAIYSCIYAILGVVLLALIPAFRVTLLNIVIFTVGAFGGAVTFLYATNTSPLQVLKNNYVGFIILYFAAAVLGGTLLVSLKMRFIKTPDDER